MFIETIKLRTDIKTLRDALIGRKKREVDQWFVKHSKREIVSIDHLTYDNLRHAAEMHSDSLYEVVLHMLRNYK